MRPVRSAVQSPQLLLPRPAVREEQRLNMVSLDPPTGIIKGFPLLSPI